MRDEKVGWWAAIIFTLSLQSFIHGKAAVTDMWLVLFVTGGHWAGWELLKANTEHRTSNIEHRTWCWCIICLDVSGATALLFFNCLRQFFSLVDQTAGALEKPAGAS